MRILRIVTSAARLATSVTWNRSRYACSNSSPIWERKARPREQIVVLLHAPSFEERSVVRRCVRLQHDRGTVGTIDQHAWSLVVREIRRPTHGSHATPPQPFGGRIDQALGNRTIIRYLEEPKPPCGAPRCFTKGWLEKGAIVPTGSPLDAQEELALYVPVEEAPSGVEILQTLANERRNLVGVFLVDAPRELDECAPATPCGDRSDVSGWHVRPLSS